MNGASHTRITPAASPTAASLPSGEIAGRVYPTEAVRRRAEFAGREVDAEHALPGDAR